MNKLINVDGLIVAISDELDKCCFYRLNKVYPLSYFYDLILKQPTVDPVVHGRWAHLGGDEWCCTTCGNVLTTEGSWERPTKKYCDECGAKMDKED